MEQRVTSRLVEGAGMAGGAVVGALAGLPWGNVPAGLVVGAGAGLGVTTLAVERPWQRRRPAPRPPAVSPGRERGPSLPDLLDDGRSPINRDA